MRQLLIKIPGGQGRRVLDLAKHHRGQNVIFLEAEGGYDMVIVHLPIRNAGNLIDELEELAGIEMTLVPYSVLPMDPPAKKVPTYIKEVQPRSPLEIWLNAQQSIGSWGSFLGYTLVGSIIVWIAMFTNTIYLLVAAMLVSPFAGPAMNTAVATATGDKSLMRQSVVRYFFP